MAQSLHVFFVRWGRGSANNRAKSSGRTFEKLCDIRKYAHPDFLAEVQCNLGGHTIERVRYMHVPILITCVGFEGYDLPHDHYEEWLERRDYGKAALLLRNNPQRCLVQI